MKVPTYHGWGLCPAMTEHLIKQGHFESVDEYWMELFIAIEKWCQAHIDAMHDYLKRHNMVPGDVGTILAYTLPELIYPSGMRFLGASLQAHLEKDTKRATRHIQQWFDEVENKEFETKGKEQC